MPCPTPTPTFGMNRNTVASTSRIVSSVAVCTPAATEAIAFVGEISSPTSRSTRSTSTGFTHRTTTSAPPTSSALPATCRTPCARPAPPPGRSRGRRPACGRPSPGPRAPIRRTIAQAMSPAPKQPKGERGGGGGHKARSMGRLAGDSRRSRRTRCSPGPRAAGQVVREAPRRPSPRSATMPRPIQSGDGDDPGAAAENMALSDGRAAAGLAGRAAGARRRPVTSLGRWLRLR